MDDFDAIIARYFACEDVARWLLCSKPVTNVPSGALRSAFVYSIGWGRNAIGNGPFEMDIEDM